MHDYIILLDDSDVYTVSVIWIIKCIWTHLKKITKYHPTGICKQMMH